MKSSPSFALETLEARMMLSAAVGALGTSAADRWLGLGNPTYIDRDGDGYGVASKKGPDADDRDRSVHSLSQATAKYGSLKKFLSHLGYKAGRIIYVASNGSDSSGRVNDIKRPFADWHAAGVKPGDVVIYRGGTWRDEYVFNATNVHGAKNKPIVFLAMPGEKVVFDATAQGMEVGKSSYLTLDGFKIVNTRGHTGKGVGMKYSQNVTWRNIDSSGHTWGMITNRGLRNIVVEYSAWHDNPQEHGIYMGGDYDPSSNITVRHNLMYHNGRHGYQANGRISKMRVEDNIIHSNNMGGISLLLGTRNSDIRGNLIYNNNKQGIIFYNYDDYVPAYDQTGNVVENNTIWVGKNSWNGGTAPSSYCGILVNDVTNAQARDLGHNTFRNNVIVTYNGEAFRFSKSSFASTSKITGNQIYRASGSGNVMAIAGKPYNWSGLKTYKTASGNTYKKPAFKNASVNDQDAPSAFDLRIS